MDFNRIPAEMRPMRAWCVWRHIVNADGKPTKIPYSPITGAKIDPTDIAQATTYEIAVGAATSRPEFWSGIGFVLSDNDPYVFIDLDEPKYPDGSPLPADEAAARFENQKRIYEEFNSYSEFSPSGKGLHIILRGSVPAGRRRDSVEIYGSQRFMTMTGNVYRDGPINYYNGELSQLWEEMAPPRNTSTYYAGLDKEQSTDEQVLKYAEAASNGEMFADLYYRGDWQKWNYPPNSNASASSEADFALIDIIAFYSRNRAQTARLFQASRLMREKYKTHKKLLGYMLDRCFDNMPAPLDIQSIANNILAAAMAKDKAQQPAAPTQVNAAVAIDHEKDYLNLPPPKELEDAEHTVFNPPPGLLGDIARFIYQQSYMPVPEIALAGAIGLMSGICGRCYNTPTGTGLNSYTLLLAATGTGKEEAAKGIWKLMNAAVKFMPTIKDFMGPSEIASTPALMRWLGTKSASIVSILGEFGMYFKNLTNTNASPHLSGLLRTLLQLYSQSGHGQSVSGMAYSDADKNTKEIESPAFSIFAESVPENFYASLTEAQIQSGLLPRFNIIEYRGDRVDPNPGGAAVLPSYDLLQTFCGVASNAAMLNNQRIIKVVEYSEEGKRLLDELQDFAANRIRGQTEVFRQLWNRTHLKALRLACLVSVGIDPYNPIITKEAAQWAINIALYDTRNISKRFENGEVGENNHENEQVKIVLKLIHRFINEPWEKVAKTTGPKLEAAHASKLIPYTFLQKSTASHGAYRNDRMGATNALRRTLGILCERGDIQKVPKAELAKMGTQSECFAITNIDAILSVARRK